jgi:hypothetical protein
MEKHVYLKPHKPLTLTPLTQAQERRLIADLYIAIRRWPGCCKLCGWPVYQRGRGRMRRFDDPTYGYLCRVCARAADDNEYAPLIDVEIVGPMGEPHTGPLVPALGVMGDDSPLDDDGRPLPEAEDTGADAFVQCQRALHNALGSAVLIVHRNFDTPQPPPVAFAPQELLFDWLTAYVAQAADDPETLHRMLTLISDRMHAHIPGSVVYDVVRRIKSEAAIRRGEEHL